MKKQLFVLVFSLSMAGQASANIREPWMDRDDEFPVLCEPTPEMTSEGCMNMLRRKHGEDSARQAEYEALPLHEKLFRGMGGLAVVFVGIPWLISNLFGSKSGRG